MKYLFLLLLFTFLLVGSEGVMSQAFQGFENRATGVDCTSITCRYTDTDQTAHELLDMTNAEARFIPVNDVSIVDPAGLDQIGFRTYFAPTGSGTGLSDGDIFGFAKGGAITGSFGGTGAFEGNQIFFLEDVDGEITLEFTPVRLDPGATGNFTMQYIYDGSFDVGPPNDRLNISLKVTGCPAAVTLPLIDVDGASPADPEEQWNELSQSLDAYGGCDVQLVIKADVNTTSEEIGFDAISFAAGSALPVEFMDITANQHKEAVLLDWSTATEIDNRGFTVERSFDGRSFRPIGWVEGTGEAQIQVDYEFIDK